MLTAISTLASTARSCCSHRALSVHYTLHTYDYFAVVIKGEVANYQSRRKPHHTWTRLLLVPSGEAGTHYRLLFQDPL